MGVRQSINQHPMVSAGVGVAALVVALVILVGQLRKDSTVPEPLYPDRAFFSTDEGATFFSEDPRNIPPFPHEQKEALRAHVFQCQGKRFVGYLEKYTPDARTRIEQYLRSHPNEPPVRVAYEQDLQAGEVLVKRPGGSWIPRHAAEAPEVMNAKCPDGKYATPVTGP